MLIIHCRQKLDALLPWIWKISNIEHLLLRPRHQIRRSTGDNIGLHTWNKFWCLLELPCWDCCTWLLNVKMKMSHFQEKTKRNTVRSTSKFFVSLIFRWMKLRHAMVPFTMFFEPVSQCMVLGLMMSWAVNFLFDVSPLSFFLIHVLVWFLLDYFLIRVLEVGIHSLTLCMLKVHHNLFIQLFIITQFWIQYGLKLGPKM